MFIFKMKKLFITPKAIMKIICGFQKFALR